MTTNEAIKKMQAVKAYMISGNPIWSVTEMGEAFDMAIEALENYDKLAEDLQDCLEMYKKKKARAKALKRNQWIPCSERLPSDGSYLVTRKDVIGRPSIVTKRSYAKNLHKIDSYDFPSKKSGWYDYDSEYGYWEDTEVIAWMPLPKAYEGREE